MNKHYKKHPPHINRFNEFEEFYDKTGFLIREKQRTIDFFYDYEHGWFDEYGNYYNKDGNQAIPSTLSKEFWEKIRHEYDYLFFDDENDDEDFDDDLIKQYEEAINQDASDSDADDFLHEAQIEEQMASLLRKLVLYEPKSQIKVYFSGVRPKCTVDQVKNFFGSQDIKDVQFEMKGRFRTGKGFLIVKDKAAAFSVIHKYGAELEGQEVSLDIEALGDVHSDEEILQFNETKHNPQEAKHNPQEAPPQIKITPLVINEQQQLIAEPQPKLNGQYPQFLEQSIIQTQTQPKQTVPQTNQQINCLTVKVPPVIPYPQQQLQKQKLLQQQQMLTRAALINHQQNGYDILFENVPISVTLDEFEEWLMVKQDRIWQGLRDKLDDNKMSKKIKINFKRKIDAIEVVEFFSCYKALMYKGKNRLHVKKMWRD